MDSIILNTIEARGRHGVLPEETRLGQTFRATVTLWLDLRAAGENDDLARTVDYSAVAAWVHATLAGEPVKLVETLAERIASGILASWTPVQAVTVRVAKPNPPVQVPMGAFEVEIHRKR